MTSKSPRLSQLAALYPEHVARLSSGYAEACERSSFDGAVVSAGTATRKSSFDDQYWPLVPTPAFAHWLPLLEDRCALVIMPGKKPQLLRPEVTSFWEGPSPVESDHFFSEFDVVEVAEDGSDIAERLPAGKKLAFIGDDTARAAGWGIADDAVNPAALIARLDALRAIKSDYERGCIAEANRRASRGHDAVFGAFEASSDSELALHLLYLAATDQDANDTPYTNIVALGEHAATLHHVAYGRSPAGTTDSLLVDAGATCLGYASDITRTRVKGSGAGADAFGGLIAAIETMQQTLCTEATPGTSFEELHNRCHELLAGVLIACELATGDAAALVETDVTRAFLPHGLGHSLGIQVHDVGCRTKPPDQRNPFLRNTSSIEDGQVFTVEPGCYFIPGLLEPLRDTAAGKSVRWDQVDLLRPFGGIRIEDNIAIVKGKPSNLTRDNWAAAP